MTKFTSHNRTHQSEATESATAQARMDVNQSSKCYLGSAHSVIDDNRNFRFSDVIETWRTLCHAFKQQVIFSYSWILIYLLDEVSVTNGMLFHFQKIFYGMCL
ncbi:uncharacterized protein CEXT_755251 [Caerostris extrusa]|uniref:Uncharacterized protein n=1 Tax=Caerostris extrusa TaxID=172846 RepID=A0AAV4P6E0_CAEEX|nr:uncharacterized protein CEXT_755251 [Caerostris extrusa]